MTKAGLDPSRIQERAEMLAKVQGAARKRKREDADMDVDMDEVEGEDGEDGWMDVDGGDDATPNKRVKSHTGAIVPANRKAPRTDRRLAGLRDDGVRFFIPVGLNIFSYPHLLRFLASF